MAYWCAFMVLLMSLLTTAPALARNTHGLPAGAQEYQAYLADHLRGYAVRGCLHGLAGTTSVSLASCAAYVRIEAPTPYLVYVQDLTARTVSYTAGNGTYWLLLHRDTSTPVSGWTRVTASHYLWQQSATPPALPAGTLLLSQATVSGGQVTQVQDHRLPASYVRRGVYDVTDTLYGATGQGVVDDSPAIQAAINALPLHGGVVGLPPGTYRVGQTLRLGNGGVGVASTRHGILLEGLGTASYNKSFASVIVQWNTPTEAPVIAVSGPLVGWGLKNLYIDGGGTASAGIYVQSGQHGEVRDVTVAGHKGHGIHSTCVPTFPAWNGVTDALKNMWHNIWIWHLPPATPGTAGLVLDSTAITCNTDFNQFYQLTVSVAGVDGWNVYLGGADHNMFYNLHMIGGTNRSNVHFAYDNPGFHGWPCGNNFYGLSLDNAGMTHSGFPLANNTCLNYIYGMSGGDPVDFIPDLPGVMVFSGRRINQNLILVPGYNSASTQPVGHLELFTTASRPHHFIPTTDNVADLGQPSQRWKDVHVIGAVLLPDRAVTTSDTLRPFVDHYLQLTCAAACTFTLTDAAAAVRREYTIKRTNLTQVSIVATGPQLIDGLASYVLPTGDASTMGIRLRSDGVNWSIIGKF